MSSLYRYNSAPNDYQVEAPPTHHAWNEHSSLIREVGEAGQAIESIRQEEIAETGMDPMAVELLPQLAFYN